MSSAAAPSRGRKRAASASPTETNGSPGYDFQTYNDYPVSTVLMKRLTGLPEKPTVLGKETDVVHLELDKGEMTEFFFHLFQDIFHDSQGARSGEGTSMSDFFNPDPRFIERKRGLNNFAEFFLHGMNAFYGNKIGVDETETSKKIPWERAQTAKILQQYYGITTGPLEANITGVDETRALAAILEDLKGMTTNVDGHAHPVFYTQYTTSDVLKSEHPYLVSYDAGNDLLNSILGNFDYIDISIVNVKDPGDSMRVRNKLLTSIEKIVKQHPGVETGRLVKKLRADVAAAGLPEDVRRRLGDFLHFFDAKLSPTSRLGLDTQTYHVHQYISTRVLECLDKKCQAKRGGLNLIAQGVTDITPKAILDDYRSYIQRKLATIFANNKYAIHKKNVQLRVTSANLVLLDVTYGFDDRGTMSVTFNGTTPVQRANLNSAKDVGRNFKEACANYPVLKVVLSQLNQSQSASLSNLKVMGIRMDHVAALTKQLYLECMFKFIGDFAQVLYGYYLGSIFASFDRSAITMALFVMKSLLTSPERYKQFKRGGASDGDPLFAQRMSRGLLLLTSVTYHGKTVPKGTYYADIRAASNIQRGVNGRPQWPLKDYLDAMGVDRLDEDSLKGAKRSPRRAPEALPDAMVVTRGAPKPMRLVKRDMLNGVAAAHVLSAEGKVPAIVQRALATAEDRWTLYDFDLNKGMVYKMPPAKYMAHIHATVAAAGLTGNDREAAFLADRVDKRFSALRSRTEGLAVPDKGDGAWVMVPVDLHPATAGFVAAAAAANALGQPIDDAQKAAQRPVYEAAIAEAPACQEWIGKQIERVRVGPTVAKKGKGILTIKDKLVNAEATIQAYVDTYREMLQPRATRKSQTQRKNSKMSISNRGAKSAPG